MRTYKKTKTAEVINEHGLDHIQEMWTEYGLRRAAKKLETSPWVIQHIVRTNGWKRPASKVPSVLAAVDDGTKLESEFKWLDFRS